jgi:hypothetical protein
MLTQGLRPGLSSVAPPALSAVFGAGILDSQSSLTHLSNPKPGLPGDPTARRPTAVRKDILRFRTQGFALGYHLSPHPTPRTAKAALLGDPGSGALSDLVLALSNNYYASI